MPGLGAGMSGNQIRAMMPRSEAYMRQVSAYREERQRYFRGVSAAHTQLGFGLNRKASDHFTAQSKRWQAKGEQYMRKHRGTKKAWITGQYEINAQLMRVAATVFPALALAYDIELAGFAGRVFGAWPEKTGYSKSSLLLVYAYRASEFIGSFVVAAPYSRFIRVSEDKVQRKEGGITWMGTDPDAPKFHVLTRLVNQPGRGLAQAMLHTLDREHRRRIA